MKNILKTALASLMIFAAATQAKAILFTDIDTINQKLTAGGPNGIYSNTFDITDDGFVPGYHNVWAAGITFWLMDDRDNESESFTINLDGIYSGSQSSFLVLGVTQVGIDLLASLNAEGVLSYSITATSGDFWLKSAILIADAKSSPPGDGQPVPDNGSTLILAAFALIGLTFVQYRIAKRC